MTSRNLLYLVRLMYYTCNHHRKKIPLLLLSRPRRLTCCLADIRIIFIQIMRYSMSFCLHNSNCIGRAELSIKNSKKGSTVCVKYYFTYILPTVKRLHVLHMITTEASSSVTSAIKHLLFIVTITITIHITYTSHTHHINNDSTKNLIRCNRSIMQQQYDAC
jgi:hypothetical protein